MRRKVFRMFSTIAVTFPILVAYALYAVSRDIDLKSDTPEPNAESNNFINWIARVHRQTSLPILLEGPSFYRYPACADVDPGRYAVHAYVDRIYDRNIEISSDPATRTAACIRERFSKMLLSKSAAVWRTRCEEGLIKAVHQVAQERFEDLNQRDEFYAKLNKVHINARTEHRIFDALPHGSGHAKILPDQWGDLHLYLKEGRNYSERNFIQIVNNLATDLMSEKANDRRRRPGRIGVT